MSLSKLESLGPQEEKPVNLGLVFSPAGRVMVTGNHYVVPFLLNKEELFQPLAVARDLSDAILWNVGHMDNGSALVASLQNTVLSFQHEFNIRYDDLSNYVDYLMSDHPWSRRHRRGAIDIMGQFANVLFGTATQQQVDDIHARLGQLETMSEKERSVLNVHSRILNSTIRDVSHMQAAILKIQKAANISYGIIRMYSLKTLELESEVKIYEALFNLQLALSDIIADHVRIKLGIQEML